jgi:hypothetical protein
VALVSDYPGNACFDQDKLSVSFTIRLLMVDGWGVRN